MVGTRDEFIAHIYTASLRQLHWPFLRVLAPGYVEHFELTHYLDRLLASGDWLSVRAVPHQADGRLTNATPREFDIYGHPVG
jgi:hypothetical protein